MARRPRHVELQEDDSFTIPPGCIGRVYRTGRKMGTFTFVYNYALSKAGINVKDAVKTLIQLMSNIDKENIVYVDTKVLSDKICMTRNAVHLHLNILRDNGLIIPHEETRKDAKAICRWRICPFLGWHGTKPALENYITSLPINHPFFKYSDPEFFTALKEEIAKSTVDDIEEQE